MLIDLIVGVSLLVFLLCFRLWARSPALRESMERPKYIFLDRVREHDSLESNQE